MLVVVSPAKTLDYVSKLATLRYTLPMLTNHSEQLIEICKVLTPVQLSKLMKVSDKIASLNALRFTQWSCNFTTENARPAILAFKGDVYTGLDAPSLSEDDFDWAQSHLCILSGLYGLLRPLDLMQPYRLEMGTKLANTKGRDLYHFWGDIITNKLNDALQEQGGKYLINLASNEYFKAIKPSQLNAKIITPVFKDEKNGQYKIISFFAKKARGMMARFIIDNRIDDPLQLTSFDCAGYLYCEQESSCDKYVFKRAAQ